METQKTFWPDLSNSNRSYKAIYFCMGSPYNENDGLPEFVGLDCPYGDESGADGSPVIEARTKDELREKIQEVFDGELGIDFTGTHPDIIVDEDGTIQRDIYADVCGHSLYTTLHNYSGGRESLEDFWSREKWRWGFDD